MTDNELAIQVARQTNPSAQGFRVSRGIGRDGEVHGFVECLYETHDGMMRINSEIYVAQVIEELKNIK